MLNTIYVIDTSELQQFLWGVNAVFFVEVPENQKQSVNDVFQTVVLHTPFFTASYFSQDQRPRRGTDAGANLHNILLSSCVQKQRIIIKDAILENHLTYLEFWTTFDNG